MAAGGELIMETISNIIYHDLNIKKYLGDSNSCFIDIETTGLSRKNNMIYLIGLLYFNVDSNTWILKQYFANSMDKEAQLLNTFISDIFSFDKLITYNGDSFDLPFINHRLAHYNIDTFINLSKSFDLYRVIRQNRQYLDLENLKLKTIEESLGFFRKDMYSGFDCIGFYHNYTNSKNPVLRDNILKHNYDDLVHMLDIMIILDILDEKKSFYANPKNSSRKFTMDDIKIIGDMIYITGIIGSPLTRDIKHYGSNYNILTEQLDRFQVSLEFKEGYITEKDKCIYIDTLDFESLDLKGDTNYNLPNNIFVLMIEKKYCVDNIKNLLMNLFQGLII